MARNKEICRRIVADSSDEDNSDHDATDSETKSVSEEFYLDVGDDSATFLPLKSKPRKLVVKMSGKVVHPVDELNIEFNRTPKKTQVSLKESPPRRRLQKLSTKPASIGVTSRAALKYKFPERDNDQEPKRKDEEDASSRDVYLQQKYVESDPSSQPDEEGLKSRRREQALKNARDTYSGAPMPSPASKRKACDRDNREFKQSKDRHDESSQDLETLYLQQESNCDPALVVLSDEGEEPKANPRDHALQISRKGALTALRPAFKLKLNEKHIEEVKRNLKFDESPDLDASYLQHNCNSSHFAVEIHRKSISRTRLAEMSAKSVPPGRKAVQVSPQHKLMRKRESVVEVRKNAGTSQEVPEQQRECSRKRKSSVVGSLAPGRSDKARKRIVTRREEETNEMWKEVAGHGVGKDSEEDEEGLTNDEDANFIDDPDTTEDERYIIDEKEGLAKGRKQAQAEEEAQAEEDVNFSKLFSKRRQKLERTAEDIAMAVELFIARMDVAAKEDQKLNAASQPAIAKLTMLQELSKVFQKRHLQQEFLDRGVLSSISNWLEPLPDGSLPNINVRTTLLQLLMDLPINLELYDRREQLKKSGLGKVVMLLCRLPEETSSNRKLAKELVETWGRALFEKTTRYEHLRTYIEKPLPVPQRKPANHSRFIASNAAAELDLWKPATLQPKPGDRGHRQRASIPEALPLVFSRRPVSKVNNEEVYSRARQQQAQELNRLKMNKKLQQLMRKKS